MTQYLLGVIMNRYHKIAVCHCKWWALCPFGELFHLHYEVCPVCGRDKETFTVATARVVSSSVWYKPWTWFTTTLEIK